MEWSSTSWYRQWQSVHIRRRLCCDWVVHGGLAGTEAHQVLIEMDDRLKDAGVRKPWEIDPDGRVHEMVSHRALQQEMSRYLNSAGVSDAWTRDPLAWHEVSRFYSEIVKDSPLTITRKDYGVSLCREARNHRLQANPRDSRTQSIHAE